MQGEELRERRAELGGMHPIRQCLKVPVAVLPKQGVISYFPTRSSCLCKRHHSPLLFCFSPSASLNICTWLRGTQTFFVACQFMSVPPFSVTFLLHFSGFKKFLYIGNISFYPQHVFRRSPPSMWAALLLPLQCFWQSLTKKKKKQKPPYNEVYSSLDFLPLHFETVGKFCFTNIKKKFDHILS